MSPNCEEAMKNSIVFGSLISLSMAISAAPVLAQDTTCQTVVPIVEQLPTRVIVTPQVIPIVVLQGPLGDAQDVCDAAHDQYYAGDEFQTMAIGF
jgi:hypothetical protein